MKVVEAPAKSILVKSKLPDADYVVNPYTGCQFACLYCYASFMGRFVDEPIGNWGNYVYVKTNAVELFRNELPGLAKKRPAPTLLLSSVTDPYQGLEGKYKLTRGILQILSETQYPGRVGILTKSPMVIRDIDLLSTLPNAEVGMTVTTTDDVVSRFLEVHAPPATSRLRTLRQLADAGLETYAFVGPLLPHFRYRGDLLDDLFGSLSQAGVQSVYVEHMNLKPYIRRRLWEALAREPDEVKAVYAEACKEDHRVALQSTVSELLKKHHLRLRLSEVLYHNKALSGASD